MNFENDLGHSLMPGDGELSERPSLLFVDDERAILTAMRVVFRGAYDVTVTTDGNEAIELMRNKRFHVIVCDQRMPIMPGVEVLRHARDLSPATIRILLTGYADTDAILGAINDVEVHRFLQKPWDNAALKRVVDEAIALARRLEEDDAQQEDEAGEDAVLAAPVARAEAAQTAAEEPLCVLVVDPDGDMPRALRQELPAGTTLAHAKDIDGAFHSLCDQPVGVIVCAFDVQSAIDRDFIRILKINYPSILVIAVCDSVDTVRLIELINHMKIFRYVRTPVNPKMLGHYVASAGKLIAETRANRRLVLLQRPEPVAGTTLEEMNLASGTSTHPLARRFTELRASWRKRLASWFS
jgi:serine/threonine-protein kinase